MLWDIAISASRVFISQKWIIRLIFNLESTCTCRNHFKQYNLLILPENYIFKCIIYVKMNIRKFSRNIDIHPFYTRNSDSVCIPMHISSVFEKSPDCSRICLYNYYLSNLIKHVYLLSLFKTKIRKYLVKRCPYSLDEFISKNNSFTPSYICRLFV